MDRLREGDREKRYDEDEAGELVVREDGSQAIKKRRRKRRSKQEKHEVEKRKKRLRLLQFAGLLGLPLVIGIFFVVLVARYHSPSFEKNLKATLWERMGARVDFERLSPMFLNVGAKSVQANWPDGGILERFSFESVDAQVDWYRYFTGGWSGEQLIAQEGFVLFSERSGRGVQKVEGQELGMPGFDSYRCGLTSMYFGEKNSPFRLAGADVSFTPGAEGGDELLVTGGKLRVPGWGDWPVRRGTFRFGDSGCKVVSLRLGEGKRGLVLSGELNLADERHQLAARVEEERLSDLPGKNLGQFIDGEIKNQEGRVIFEGWDVLSHRFELEARPKFVSLKKLPFLEHLNEIYGETKYLNPEFSSLAEVKLARGDGWSSIEEMDLRETGLLAVKGRLGWREGRLSGELLVGLPDHKTILLKSKKRQQLLENSEQKDGYFWVSVEVSGTPESPVDSFSQYLGDEDKGGSEGVFDQLTK
ncbi:MAG: hypothetical protein AAGC74_05065 [Verrucomicrobiota bacterium]